MSIKNDTELFRRIATKKQKNLMLSREVIGVLAELVDEGGQSALVERAIWTTLLDEYGEEEIQEAIEEVQAGLDEWQKLDAEKPYTLPA